MHTQRCAWHAHRPTLTQRLAHLPQHLEAAQQRATDELHLHHLDAASHTASCSGASRRCSGCCSAAIPDACGAAVAACCQAGTQLLQAGGGSVCCSSATSGAAAGGAATGRSSDGCRHATVARVHGVRGQLAQRWPHVDGDVCVRHDLGQPHLQELNL
jgi:hypothetical protein